VAIGVPISNTQAYVVDQAMDIAAAGLHGELYIGGAGLARGYLRQPALTAERFVPNAWSASPGERLYRSGDRVRLLDGGVIDFVERIDAQVKIRGFRVDLGEVEAHLRAHPAVQDAVAVTRADADGRMQLVAYLIAADGVTAPSAKALRADLQANIPKYMIPSACVWLDSFPLTGNGKLDRRALPAPVFGDRAAARLEPRSETERAVAEVWSAVLGQTGIGLDEDFFELGGHSLLATQVLSRLRQRFGADLPFQIIFECPTVAQLAETIDGIAANPVAVEQREELEI
jgi:hypothetical protein